MKYIFLLVVFAALVSCDRYDDDVFPEAKLQGEWHCKEGMSGYVKDDMEWIFECDRFQVKFISFVDYMGAWTAIAQGEYTIEGNTLVVDGTFLTHDVSLAWAWDEPYLTGKPFNKEIPLRREGEQWVFNPDASFEYKPYYIRGDGYRFSSRMVLDKVQNVSCNQ